MTEDKIRDIEPDEVDWDNAVVREGQQAGSVVSVRLSPEETVRLRLHADMAGVTVSQLLRRALAAYEPSAKGEPSRKVFVSAFTYAAGIPASFEAGWTYSGLQQLWWAHSLARAGTAVPTATEPTRIVERVTTEPLRALK